MLKIFAVLRIGLNLLGIRKRILRRRARTEGHPANAPRREGELRMSDQLQDAALRADLVRCTADIVGAYVGNNKTSSDAIPGLIEMVFTSFNRLNGSSASRSAPSRKAAISVKKSVTPDYLVCLEDGKKLKMLKRHLRTNYDMTPEEYRNKWACQPTTRWSPPTMRRNALPSPRKSVWDAIAPKPSTPIRFGRIVQKCTTTN